MPFVHLQTKPNCCSPDISGHPALLRKFSGVIGLCLFFIAWQGDVLAADPEVSALAAARTPAPSDNGDWKGDTILIANDVKNIQAHGAASGS